ncbi:hypothetical protein IJI94_02780 [Candidatus Saccharibacteria bacterium]|nr:hypothetical protein [Candidatus Saccharibacteria bacterium]
MKKFLAIVLVSTMIFTISSISASAYVPAKRIISLEAEYIGNEILGYVISPFMPLLEQIIEWIVLICIDSFCPPENIPITDNSDLI